MTDSVSPAASDASRTEEQAGVREGGSFGTLDSQRTKHKAQLIKIACDITAVSKRYQNLHQEMFGFSVRRVLHAMQPGKTTDFATLEAELTVLVAESKRVQQDADNAGLEHLPKRAKLVTAIRDALAEYTAAVSEASLKLNLICRNLRLEREGKAESADYSTGQFRGDKASYDAAVQEFKRWGVRLNALFEKL